MEFYIHIDEGKYCRYTKAGRRRDRDRDREREKRKVPSDRRDRRFWISALLAWGGNSVCGA